MLASVIVILILVASGLVAFIVLGVPKSASTSSAPPSSPGHTVKAPLVLLGPISLPGSVPTFFAQARAKYNFTFATPLNFTSVESEPFVVAVASNATGDPVLALAASVLSSNGITPRANETTTFHVTGGWARGQSDFVLYNYDPQSLVLALSAFIQNPGTPDPSVVSRTGNAADPLLDATYQFFYALDQYTNLPAPYDYYNHYSYAVYASNDGFWSGPGTEMPKDVGVCSPPEPGDCVALYIGVPVFGTPAGIVEPTVELSSEGFSFGQGETSVGVQGSVEDGSYATSSVTFNPGPNATETVTSTIDSLQELMAGNVTMYSTPILGEVFGSFTWNYGLYPLAQVTASIGNVPGLTPSAFTALFEPLALTAPATFTNSSGSWTFSYWSIQQEVGSNVYYQTCQFSTCPIEAIGPTQGRAVYWQSSLPGTVGGLVAYWPGSFPIPGVTVTFTNAQTGAVAATAVSDVSGHYTTQSLPTGTYNITATKAGYGFIPQESPVSVWGNAEVNIYDYAFPDLYQPSTTPEPILPAGQCGPMNMDLAYPSSAPVPGNTITGSLLGGTVTSQGPTNSNGTEAFTWCAGSIVGSLPPGWYNIRFSTTLDRFPLVRNVVASVVNLSLAAADPTLLVAPGSNGTETISSQFLGQWLDPYFVTSPAYLSIASALPAGTTASFSPASVSPISTGSNLELSVGGATPLGTYPVTVTATDGGPGWWGSPLTANATFNLEVASCSSGMGGISGAILNPDGNAVAGNITITKSSGVFVENLTTTSGSFSSGLTLAPGTYLVTAYTLFANPYATQSVTVTACNTSTITLTSRADLSVTVTSAGYPVAGLNVSILYQGFVVDAGTTDSAGVYNTGFTLNPTSLIVEITYNGQTKSMTVSPQAGVVTQVTIAF